MRNPHDKASISSHPAAWPLSAHKLGLLRGRDRPDKASHLLRRDMAKRGRLNTRKKGKAKNGAKWGHNFTPKTLPHDC